MRRFIKKLLGKKGLQIRKSVAVNLRDQTMHPLELVYAIDKPVRVSSFLINIPVSRCRTQIWNTLENDKNPFVKTLTEYAKGKGPSYNNSFINDYYQNYVPQNAAEVIRLPDNKTLKTISPTGYVLPWENRAPEEAQKIRERDALQENMEAGQKLSLSFGYTDFGPVREEKGVIEFNRLVNIYEKIRKQGYRENHYIEDGGIRGYFLIGNKEDEWCFMLKSGKHRAYSLSALGYSKIPIILDVNFSSLKRIRDLNFWPQVIKGVFSPHEADKLATEIIRVNHPDT